MKKILAICFALLCVCTAHAENLQVATFAGGCFWCVESDMDKVPGVVKTISGFMGGHVPNPTYEMVSAGGTGYAESVQVTYDADKVSYAHLLDYYWKHIDPTVKDQQFCDHGTQYRTVIFYGNEKQKELAFKSLKQLEKTKPFKGPIYTEIVAASQFYPAEEYHQDYYKKNPLRYHFYRYRCGRDQRVAEVWGKK